MLKPTLKDLILQENDTVFLRADLNVPLKIGKIVEDYKLQSILPTIDYLLNKKCKIVLASHLGRPKLENKNFNIDQSLSTSIFIDWFAAKDYKIKYLSTIDETPTFNDCDIVLLENLRFFSGEQKSDPQFATKLKKLANFYVNDAFALIHRNDTSITLLPELFEKNKKAFGLLMEKEFNNLQKIKNNPKQPFILILGGNKVADKIPLIEAFLDKPQAIRPQSILICGAMAYTFLKSQGQEVGKSLVEIASLEIAQNIMQKAKNQNVNIILPIDSYGSENLQSQTKILIDHKNFPNNLAGFDIGPKTIEMFCNEIKSAKTIFLNGTAGVYTHPHFAAGSRTILEAVATSDAYTVIGGGDGVAAAFLFNVADKIDYLSTGGGATLDFLSNKNEDFVAIKSMQK
ncbi:TPA: phosphoglycerate kinase [Candidatus Dependentiae bacterium]|nr:MAG: Phosphoglycerate kinase [candidate division TM6 bacterium GW2011_GWE2_31_21]KKP53625.1 MAG: Phosphoglycerate kinase [candidate division TM6 bacterium GW2011_GWF2_33_332]HBS48135.1 phosphoglycerate kinase [Candidatus Dependentiae bacterium]HBZ73559.1 phosphoglycerate kinase [Candidatus Dependentiae bacterium]